MNFLQAIILGIVEGLTEYLPISSTFHLIWASKFLALGQTEFQKMFEIVIQSGAILSVVLIYFRELLIDRKLLTKIFVSFIPTALVGLVLYKVIKNVFFESLWMQLIVFALVGLVFILFERSQFKNRLTRTIPEITYQEAIIVGLVQSLAIFPGVSRAGAVMLILMFLKIRRDEAAKYSFLLAVPTLLAASALDLVKSRQVLFHQAGNLPLLFVGFVVSMVAAFVVIKWFIGYLQKHDLALFGYYRIALAVSLSFLMIL